MACGCSVATDDIPDVGNVERCPGCGTLERVTGCFVFEDPDVSADDINQGTVTIT